MKKLSAVLLVGLFVPAIAHAQTLFTFLASINTLIAATFPVIISLAVLFFLYGLLKYMLRTDSPEERANARSVMIWGVIIIFVMTSIWGFVNLLGDIFVADNTVPDPPTLNTG